MFVRVFRFNALSEDVVLFVRQLKCMTTSFKVNLISNVLFTGFQKFLVWGKCLGKRLFTHQDLFLGQNYFNKVFSLYRHPILFWFLFLETVVVSSESNQQMKKVHCTDLSRNFYWNGNLKTLASFQIFVNVLFEQVDDPQEECRWVAKLVDYLSHPV